MKEKIRMKHVDGWLKKKIGTLDSLIEKKNAWVREIKLTTMKQGGWMKQQGNKRK